MAQPYKLAIGVTIDPAGAKAGGAAAQSAVAAIGTEAQLTATKLQQLINTSVGLNTGAANQNVREWTGALAAQGKAIDDLRAKYNPLFAVIREYKSSLTEIRTLHAQGVLSSNEMAAAIGRERQATLASIEAIKSRNQLPDHRPSPANQNFAATNVAYQLQDIFTTAPFMSAATVGLQQGPQLASNFAGQSLKQVGTTLAAAATQILSPVSLIAIGFTAATAAAIQFGTTAFGSVNKVEDALEKHEAVMKRIRQLYDDAGKSSAQYGQRTQAAIQFATNQDRSDLQKALAASLKQFSVDATPKVDTSQFFLGLDVEALTKQMNEGRFNAFTDQVADFVGQARQGKGDVLAFYEQVQKVANADPANEKLQAAAKLLEGLTQNARAAAEAIGELEREQGKLSLDTTRTQAAENARKYQAANVESQFYLRRQQDAALAGIDARSPAEIAASTRKRLEAEPVDPSSETNATRQLRIENEVTLARLQAEQQLREAAAERARSLDLTIKGQQLELSLIGQTVGETERLRMEQQLISQLEAEAAKNHTTVDPKEIAAIKEKAAAYGALAEQIAATNLLRDQDQQIAQLKTEASLVGASDEARRRGLASLEAEQQLISRGIDLNSSYADSFRKNALAISDMTNQLRKQNEAWDKVRQSGENTIDSLVDGLTSGNIGDALGDIAKDIAGTFTDLAIKNPLKNSLLGTDYGTISDVGGLGGIFGRLFGGGDTTAIPGLAKSVGSMSVNAGTVMINGGVSGLGAIGSSGSGGSILSRIFGSANDNSSVPAATSNMAAYRQAIKDLESSGGNYNALGPLTARGDRAYGAYQVMGSNIPSWTEEALGRRLTPSQFLASPAAQDSVFDRFFGKSVSKYGNPQDAASVWFTGRPQALAGNATDVFGTTSTKYVEKFNASLSRLDTTTTGATNSLGTFGNGLGQFGQNLSNSFPPAPSGGGGNWFSSLFGGLFGGGGLNTYGKSVLSSSSQFSSAWGAGGIGLFDRGGWTGYGAVDEPAGVVHRGEIVWSQKDIARNGGPDTVEAMRLGKRGYLSGGMVGGGLGSDAGGMGGRPTFQIINQTSTPINGQVEEGQDETGRRNWRLTLSDQLGNAGEEKGGGFRRMMGRQYGVRPRGIDR